MEVSDSNEKLRSLINKAIKDGIITRDEYEEILQVVNEDGHNDDQEKALIGQLHEMIEDKTIRFKI